MELSHRLSRMPEQFFASLVKKIDHAISEGRDIINLGQGNPDQPTPLHIVQALQSAVANPQTHRYSPFRGIPQLKQAAADFYAREYDIGLDPATEIAILFGSKAGLAELPLALLNEGDLMLLPDPGYPDYLSGAALAGVKFDTLPLLARNNYLPDFNHLSNKQKSAAKLMYLNYPNNPTGAVADVDFFDSAVSLAKNSSIGIVHDFAYGAIGFDNCKPISFLQAKGAKDVGVELYTFSKTYNMAGWRIGFAAGNAKMVEALEILQDHLYVSLFPAVQQAAAEALNGSQQCVYNMVALYQERRKKLMDACRNIGWQMSAPKGSFFAWLPVPNGFTSESFADFLLEYADVGVAPGNGFGEYGEGYVRVGLVVDAARIEEAIKRIGRLGIFR
ncbi:pyridoxal phosphate-dependent aminotransferase [Virgibacillus halophilus]|uniref:pyridoxal phosphate-dependent aminotransferase n=1 Tax=Tigheibacillus halophilus TaxID=361280 RepID=UPI00363BE01B